MSKDHEATQAAVAEAGSIAPLVTLLDGQEGGGGADAQQEAAGALLALADYKPNRLAITAAEGIGRLVNLLATNSMETRAHAEGVLLRLTMETSNRSQIIQSLVEMLRLAGMTGQEQAAAALANLARESEDNRNSILNTDGIPPILALLDSKSQTAKENAVVAITELARGSMENQAAVAAAGGVKKIVGLMHGFSAQTKDTAAWRLCALAAAAIRGIVEGDGESVNSENQDAIAQAGAMAPLVTMLGVPSPQLQANVAAAMARASQRVITATSWPSQSWARSLRYWASCERARQTSRTAPRPPSGRCRTRMFTIRIRSPNWAALTR